MKASRLAPVRRLKNYKFWLFGLAVGLAVLHLNLTWTITANIDLLSVSVLCWLAFLSVVWKKRHTLCLDSDIFSSICGLLLIALILIKSTSLFWFESEFIKISCLVSFIGLGLVASGVKGIKQYWQELLILIVLLLPLELLAQQIDKIINVSLLAAKFSTFVLWYLGFEVSRQGVSVILPTGAIEIYPACSGLNAILLLLQLAFLFIIVFPIQWYKKILVPVISIFLAFTINVIRLVLMAVVVASSNQEAFQYWHGEDGAKIFSTISILMFGMFCRSLIHRNKALKSRSV